MRFSSRSMLVAFVLLSVVLAGLASPNRWWTSVATTALVVWLMSALALAIGGETRRRVTWFAVLLVGVGYMYSASRLQPNQFYVGLSGYQSQGSQLLTTQLLSHAYLLMHPPDQNPPATQPGWRSASPTVALPALPAYASPIPTPYASPGTAVAAPNVPINPYEPVQFLAVGECFFAFLFSLAGGRLAGWAYDRRTKPLAAESASLPVEKAGQ